MLIWEGLSRSSVLVRLRLIYMQIHQYVQPHQAVQVLWTLVDLMTTTPELLDGAVQLVDLHADVLSVPHLNLLRINEYISIF